MVAILANDQLEAQQREVQRVLGKVLIKLQLYESLTKAVLAHHRLSGPAHSLDKIQAENMANTSGKTLGTLVKDLLGSYVTIRELGGPEDETTISPEGSITISFRAGLEVSGEDFSRITNELKELVSLRNNLVHHFIDQHDLWSLEGCHGAQDALVASSNNIDQHLEQLRVWAENMQDVKRQAAAFMQSNEGRDLFVNGIAPDGTVYWPVAGIVYALRRAANELAIDGWTCLAAAIKLIREREPEQSPEKYGCRSWPQVVHESRIFELRYFEIDGRRSARYRVSLSIMDTLA